MISVIVPAHNEEAWLPSTLGSIRAAAEHVRARSGVDIETVVVDNDSTDETAVVARDRGATVVHERVRSIGRARNAGARHASGEVLVFVDADVYIPRDLLAVIHETMRDPRCLGGGVDTEHHPRRLVVRLHLRAWRVLAAVIPLVQGATQFSRRSAFDEVGGYPEDVWMGEDTDFYGNLRRLARETGGYRPPDPGAARETLQSPLRRVAAVEDPDLDQSALRRALPPVEGRLGGLVRPPGAVNGSAEGRPLASRTVHHQ